MTFIDDIKIGKKLLGGFIIVLLLLSVVAFIGYSGMTTIKAGQDATYSDRLIPISQLGVIDSGIQQMRADLYPVSVTVPESRSDIDTSIPALIADMDKSYADYKAANADPAEKALQATFETDYAAYKLNVQKTMQDAKSRKYCRRNSSNGRRHSAGKLAGSSSQGHECPRRTQC